MNKIKNLTWLPIITVIFTVLIKSLFLLTHHIQEDAFITWRVAQNLLDYGVIGLNGYDKISSSTSHLYVFISYLFNLVLGKEDFIYPLLTFNSLLFTIGSYWLSKIIFKKPLHQALFILLFGLLPPAIKISILGMEYGLLFFLQMGLLYWAFYKENKWAYLILPALILFTRIDTVIFLGVVFLIDLLRNKTIRWYYILGIIIGISSVLSFNWFYFDEIVNHTITANQFTYDSTFTLNQHLIFFCESFGNFWGMVKLPTAYNPITIVLLVFELVSLVILLKDKTNRKRNTFLLILFVFGWVKQILLLSHRSLVDWHYWIPQIVLFIPILVLLLEKKENKYGWLFCFVVFYSLPMIAYQTVDSIAIGNDEWNYRKSIGIFLDEYEKDKSNSIFLELTGYIPYFSGLKTIDEVGLVDKGVQEEILKDKSNYRFNTIKIRKPKYVLSYTDLYKSKEQSYYKIHYKLIKKFRIKDYLKHPNPYIEKIYRLKHSSTDYNLYERK